MKYMFLICGDEAAAEHANDGCEGWNEEMLRRGVVQDGGGLRPPGEARTLRIRDDETLISDGPFAETKEQIGGYCIIDCTGLDEAIEIAGKHPAARYGTIEIRPLLTP